MLRYYHKPFIGDIIYSLPVIKHLGKGILYLDCDPGTEYVERLKQCFSFIRLQPYIEDCCFYSGQGWDYNLDAYNMVPGHLYRQRVTIVDSHFRGIGLDPPPEITPWLIAERGERTFPVVIHRSPRYQGEVDYTFLHKIKSSALYCIGFEEEAKMFVEVLGATWLPTPDLAAVAAVINSCNVFIGNQSSPLAVAVGLGKNRLIEECPWWPNCTYRHTNEYRLGMDADRNFALLQSFGYSP